MADDKKIIFSMVGVSKMFPPHKQVLKDIYLSFFYGAKIGIIGLNGSGKSTLLKIIAGVEKSYQGEVVFSPGYSVGYLEQEPKLDPEKTVKEVVQEGVQPILDLLAEYEKVNESFGDPDVLEDPDKMEALIQHNEADIATWIPLEYELNFTYGSEAVMFSEYLTRLRAEINRDCAEKIEAEKAGNP